MNSKDPSYEVGIAIAGGGVSGAAAVGVLQALAEAGISVTHIGGSSSGSIVAALYALGYPPEELKTLIPLLTKKQLDFDRRGIAMRLLRIHQSLDGFIKGIRLHSAFRKLTQDKSVSEVPLPLAVVATDLRTGRPVVFSQQKTRFQTISDVPLADALRASCAIPVLFKPFRLNGSILVDGGVSMNCPICLVKEMGAKFVIAVDTITAFANEQIGEHPSTLSILTHVINLTLRNQMEVEHPYADILYHPHVGTVGALDFHKLEQCMEAGYRYAIERMPELLMKLGKL